MEPSPENPRYPSKAEAQNRSPRFGKYLKRFRSAFRFRRRPQQPSPQEVGTHIGNFSGDQIPHALEENRPPQATFASSSNLASQREDNINPNTFQPLSEVVPTTERLYETRSAVEQGETPASQSQTSSLALPNPEYPRPDYRSQRATELFARYGFDLDPEVDPYQDQHLTSSQLQRVEKPVVVRVHHHCHHCRLAIGPTGICVNCGHKLCKKCHRFPEKKTGGLSTSKGKKREAPSDTRSETLDNWLSGPTSSLAFRPAAKERTLGSIFLTRRIRRQCHKCSSPFIWTERTCQNCDHVMCNTCPNELALAPYSPTEPDQEEPSTSNEPYTERERILKRPRLRVRQKCESCGTLFREASNICASCEHFKCTNCPRDPPERTSSPEPSSDILESLKRRLGGFVTPASQGI